MLWFLFVTHVLGCAALTAGLNRLAARPWLRSEGLHWTERARLLYPVLYGGRLNIVWIALAAALAQLSYPAGLRLPAVAGGIAGWIGATLGTYPLDHRIRPELTFRKWLTQVLLSWGMLLPYLALLPWLIWTMPDRWGWGVVVRVFGFLGFSAWWFTFGFRQGLSLFGAVQPADERLQSIVDERSRRLGVVVRRVWVLESSMANAFALTAVGELLFTRQLLDRLEEAEVAAICDHELGHLSEPRSVLLGRLFGLVWFVPLLLVRPALSSGSPWVLLVALAAAGGLLAIVQRLGRRMETRADSIAASAQTDAGGYARALLRIYEINHIPAVMPGRYKLHPHLYDRLIAAGLSPDFPRPRPPNEIPWTTVLVLLLLIGLGIWMLITRGDAPWA